MKYRIYNAVFTNRHIDDNGFLFVEDNAILRDGIMEYYGSELGDTIEDIKLEPDKIYKVYLSKQEMIKSMDLWSLLAIVDDHTWLDPSNVKGNQIGSIGEILNTKEIDGQTFLYCNLRFTDKKAIEKISNNEKVELSTAYEHGVKKSSNPNYDFEIYDLKPNHLALVDEGRAGRRVRVSNENTTKSSINLLTKNNKKMADIKLIIDGNTIDLSKFFAEEKGEGDHETSITSANACNEEEDKEDKKENKKSKNEDKEEDKEEEKKEENKKSKNEDKEKKDDKDDKKSENEEDEDKKDEKSKSMNSQMINSLIEKAKEDVKAEFVNRQKAYNSVRAKVGEFDYSEMDEKGIYSHALMNSGIELSGNESLEALQTAFKVFNSQNRIESFNADAGKDLIPSHII